MTELQQRLVPDPVAPATDGRRTRAARWATHGTGRRTTVLVTLALIAITFVMLSPIIWTSMVATKPTSVAFASPPQFTYEPTFDAFVRLWQATNFYKYLINTLIVAVVSVVVTLLIAAPAAYALSRFGGKTSAAILSIALLFRAIPGFALVLPFYNFANQFGIYDTNLALSIAFVAVDLPFTIWLLRGFFVEIPKDLDEAALIDGLSQWGALRRIILPVATPGLITAAILTFLLAFQEYTLPVVLTDTQSKTVPVFLASQVGQTLPLLQQAAAGIVLLVVPIVLLAFLAQRYLVAGLTGGAVKG